MPPSGHYISASDVSNWPSGITEAEQQALINVAEEIIEAATKSVYYSKTLDIKLNGNDKNRLFLPIRTKLLTVTHIYVNGIELDTSWYTWDSNSVFIDLTTSGAGACDPELKYMLNQVETEGIFPHGYNNIRITGTHGVSTIPAWVKKACAMLVESDNDPTLYEKYLLGSESIGRYSYSLGDAKLWKTGVREVDKLINLFKSKKGIIMTP